MKINRGQAPQRRVQGGAIGANVPPTIKKISFKFYCYYC